MHIGERKDLRPVQFAAFLLPNATFLHPIIFIRLCRVQSQVQLLFFFGEAFRSLQLSTIGKTKVVLYRDTVSVAVEPVSRPFLDSVSVSKDTFMVVGRCRVEKIHFAYANNTFCVSTGLETVSESVSKDTLMYVDHNLEQN